MKTLAFTKYQGTGNDFVLIDNRSLTFPKNSTEIISFLCHRKFGIGSDGLILIEDHPELDFEMVFYNPDGSQSFCGNGSRCAVAFAHELKIIGTQATFHAIDGSHSAQINTHNVRVKMADAGLAENCLNGQFIDTGSPHYVQYVSGINGFNVFNEGKALRNRLDIFGSSGTNVNFIEESAKGRIFVRTYERGVENETLSCGTGVTAAALIYGTETGVNSIDIESLGGKLRVEFEQKGDDGFHSIYLSGPADKVFGGEINIPDNLTLPAE